MRMLRRNKQVLHYSLLIGSESIRDEDGNDTLEVRPIYSSPVKLRANVSAPAGEDGIAVFGQNTNYTRAVCIAGKNCPIDTTSILWFGADPESEPHNYEVAGVADSINGIVLAIREVNAGA